MRAQFFKENMDKSNASVWENFENVEDLLASIDDYMAIYLKLKGSNSLVKIGSNGEKKPRHRLPKEIEDENAWEALGAEEQFQRTMNQAKETEDRMKSLGEAVAKKYKLVFKPGPMKGAERIKEKRDKDYDGDVCRVIDFVRCSFVLKSLDQAKDIVDGFRAGGEFSNEWALTRVKDGFENANNFTVGGYRDIKLNVMNVSTGHIIEVQLHLKEYLELKEGGGHHHYEFSRKLNVNAVTSAIQILSRDELQKAYKHGSDSVQNGFVDMPALEVAKYLRRLGDIEAASRQYDLALTSYRRALDIVETLPKEQQTSGEGRSAKKKVDANVEHCTLLTAMARTITELRLLSEDEIKKDGKWYHKRWDVDVQSMYVDPVVDLTEKSFESNHPRSLRAKNLRATVVASHAHLAKLYLEEIAKGGVSLPSEGTSVDAGIKDQLAKCGARPRFVFVLNRFKDHWDESKKEQSNYMDGFVEYYNWLLKETKSGYKKNLERQEPILGEHHPEVMETQFDLASFLTLHYQNTNEKNLQGEKIDETTGTLVEVREALEIFQKSLKSSLAQLGWLSPITAKGYAGYAQLLSNPQNKKLLETNEGNSVELLKNKVKDQPWPVWSNLHLGLGRLFPKELEAKFQDELDRCKSAFGEDSQETKDAWYLWSGNVASLYSAGIKNGDEMASFLEELLSFLERILEKKVTEEEAKAPKTKAGKFAKKLNAENMLTGGVGKATNRPTALRLQLCETLKDNPGFMKDRPGLRDHFYKVLYDDAWSDNFAQALDRYGLEPKSYELKELRRHFVCCKECCWDPIDNDRVPGATSREEAEKTLYSGSCECCCGNCPCCCCCWAFPESSACKCCNVCCPCGLQPQKGGYSPVASKPPEAARMGDRGDSTHHYDESARSSTKDDEVPSA